MKSKNAYKRAVKGLMLAGLIGTQLCDPGCGYTGTSHSDKDNINARTEYAEANSLARDANLETIMGEYDSVRI